jgi:hypothetical protein
MFESYTYDGLIVACSDKLQDVSTKIHKKFREWTWEDAAKAWANRMFILKNINRFTERRTETDVRAP